MKEPITIYTIMCFTKLEELKTKTGKSTGFPDFGDSYIAGFYTDFETAKEDVEHNACDINETCYDYAIIEKVEEGLYRPATKEARWLYQFNYLTKQYEPIDEPPFLQHICGITMN